MKIERSRYMAQVMNRMEFRFWETGIVHTDSMWRATNVCSPYTRLYFVVGGSGVLQSGMRTIPLEPGNLYLIPAGHTFSYSSPVELDKLYFHVSILRTDGCELLLPLNRVIQEPFPAEHTKQLEQLYLGGNALDAFLLDAEVRRAMAELLARSGFEAPPIGAYSEPVERAIQFIQQHLSLQLTASSIAESLYLSESQLSRRFREEVGRTVSRYIDDLLFFSAQMQLANTDRPIGEISEGLGFCDQFYFSRRFHQCFGITPRKYRARLMAEYHSH